VRWTGGGGGVDSVCFALLGAPCLLPIPFSPWDINKRGRKREEPFGRTPDAHSSCTMHILLQETKLQLAKTLYFVLAVYGMQKDNASESSCAHVFVEG
jgi:hypothetical protein